ncbi:MAG TPA: arginine--tRNA ligase [Candidatus Limnocylindrales bacterium]|nr:arginine--tRNA ligase [Candidatus Limnocylindrales bacterium]
MTTSSDPTEVSTLRQAARQAVASALARAIDSGLLPDLPGARAVEVDVSRPANPEHGDVASNVALRLARPMRMAPPAIAAVLAAELSAAMDGTAAVVASAEAAGPGFVNLHYGDVALEGMVDRARRNPEAWGRAASSEAGGASGRHVNVEFVSANPTGPLTVGNARGAFVGDLLARVLEAGGQRVTREYYFNDSGAQVRNLGASVLALRDGRDVPEDGYHGEYVADLARELPDGIVPSGGDEDSRAWAAGRWASDRIRAGIEASLERLGAHFDVWTTEGSLHENGWVSQAMERLRAGGHLYERDGATWFRSTAFGDDKDRVLVKSDGSMTYFASDIGYVIEKFSRGFDHLIYIWGSDHHGTVARLRNAAEAMGFDKAVVEVILTGWVHFVEGGRELSMSKRAGTFIALDDLLEQLGVDAARWYFASRGANVNMDVDLEVARKQSSENPVYYVQYAHARIASILRKAEAAGLAPSAALEGSGLLAGGPEGTLARIVARLPEVIEDAAAVQETQGVTTYATELATAFHAFYRDARVVDPEAPELSAQRLALVDATRISLANALGLLGISAPDSM